ncbi:hypothetical protein ABT173_36850 [Streptomyces sp. NPDC001795]|uniref:hypothetical protein n=1 Tax=Streptomyces sp. NPDC001795 TaxID=3154525 RepID=UPI0033226B08
MIDKSDIKIERLSDAEAPRFLEFADRATLRSLASVRVTGRVAVGQTYLCAVYLDRVIGCTSWYESCRRSYVDLDGVTVQPTSVYLCSSEVLPEYRGMGVGGMLYEQRLADCSREDAPAPALMVEILGRGTPMSVDDGARPGLVWHLAHGFEIVGYSQEEDAGPVLARAVPTADASRRDAAGSRPALR